MIAILSVIVQSFHSFTAFYNTSGLKGTAWGIAQAGLFALIVDMAILFYTLRRRSDIARLAALVMVIINAYYYFQHLGLNLEFIFGCFLSLIIPVSVYFYSEEIGKDEITDTDEQEAFIEKLSNDLANAELKAIAIKNDRDSLFRELNKNKKDIEGLSSQNHEMRVHDRQIDKKYSDLLSEKDYYKRMCKEANPEGADYDGFKMKWSGIGSGPGAVIEKITVTPFLPEEANKIKEDELNETNSKFFGADIGSPEGDKTVETIFEIGPNGPEIIDSEEVNSIPFETATSAREDEKLKHAKRRHRLINAIRISDHDEIDKIAAEEKKDRWVLLEEAKEEYRRAVGDHPSKKPFREPEDLPL